MFRPINVRDQWRIFDLLRPYHGEDGNESEWLYDVLERLVKEARMKNEKLKSRHVRKSDVGRYARRPHWSNEAWVKITAVGDRKILADRDGYEDVYQNDGEWVIK